MTTRRMVGNNFADNRRVVAVAVLLHRFQDFSGIFFRHDCHHFTFIGTYNGSKHEHFAGAQHCIFHRNFGFFNPDADFRLFGQFVQRGGQTARVGSRRLVILRPAFSMSATMPASGAQSLSRLVES